MLGSLHVIFCGHLKTKHTEIIEQNETNINWTETSQKIINKGWWALVGENYIEGKEILHSVLNFEEIYM